MSPQTDPKRSPNAAIQRVQAQKYMSGFGNGFETEALPDALPHGMNSPQKCNYGLYGEQLSGTAFTAPTAQNERSWCYQIRPSVKHSQRYKRIDSALLENRPAYWRKCHQSGAVPLEPVAPFHAGSHLAHRDAHNDHCW